MKHRIPRLKLGELVSAEVEEVLSPVSIIVNFQGDLIRLSNHTGRLFKTGDKLRVQVSSVEPLGFKLASPLAREIIA